VRRLLCASWFRFLIYEFSKYRKFSQCGAEKHLWEVQDSLKPTADCGASGRVLPVCVVAPCPSSSCRCLALSVRTVMLASPKAEAVVREPCRVALCTARGLGARRRLPLPGKGALHRQRAKAHAPACAHVKTKCACVCFQVFFFKGRGQRPSLRGQGYGCAEQFGSCPWELWECWPRDGLLGFLK